MQDDPLAFGYNLRREWQCSQSFRLWGTAAHERGMSMQKGEHVTVPWLGPRLAHTLGNACWHAWNERCFNECLSTMVCKQEGLQGTPRTGPSAGLLFCCKSEGKWSAASAYGPVHGAKQANGQVLVDMSEGGRQIIRDLPSLPWTCPWERSMRARTQKLCCSRRARRRP